MKIVEIRVYPLAKGVVGARMWSSLALAMEEARISSQLQQAPFAVHIWPTHAHPHMIFFQGERYALRTPTAAPMDDQERE